MLNKLIRFTKAVFSGEITPTDALQMVKSKCAQINRRIMRIFESKKRMYLIPEDEQQQTKLALKRQQALVNRHKAAFFDNIMLSLPKELGLLTLNQEEDWAERWEKTTGKRVLMFATKDYGGSFFQWAKALNQCSEYAARHVVLHPHQFGYPLDLVCTGLLDNDWQGLESLIEAADIIHIKDEMGFYKGRNQIPEYLFDRARIKTPVVYTAYGSLFRINQHNQQFQGFFSSYDARIALTPDLISPVFKATFVPHAVDINVIGNIWKDGNIIGHSPSRADFKGTDQFLGAFENLHKEYPQLELELIQGVPHAECLVRKRKSTLFFDQAGQQPDASSGNETVIGWYGNSLLEAAVAGIPVIAHLSEHALRGADLGGNPMDNPAVLNTPLGEEGIAQTIRFFFEKNTEDRQQISQNTRTWLEDYHSFNAVAQILSRVYAKLL